MWIGSEEAQSPNKAVTLATRDHGLSKTAAPVFGFAMALGAGAGKEWYDQNVKKTYWSWKDFAWDLVGGAGGAGHAGSAR